MSSTFDLLTWALYLNLKICIVGRPIRLNTDMVEND